MCSLPVSRPPTRPNETSDDLHAVPKCSAVTILIHEVKYAEELEFDDTDVVTLFKKVQSPQMRWNQVKCVETGDRRLLYWC